MDIKQGDDLPKVAKISVAAIISLLLIIGWYFLVSCLINGQFSGSSRRGHNVEHILRLSDDPLSFIAVSLIFSSVLLFVSRYCYVLWKWIAK